jgi:hypothetical protein
MAHGDVAHRRGGWWRRSDPKSGTAVVLRLLVTDEMHGGRRGKGCAHLASGKRSVREGGHRWRPAPFKCSGGVGILGGLAGGGCHAVEKGWGGVPDPTGRRRAAGNSSAAALAGDTCAGSRQRIQTGDMGGRQVGATIVWGQRRSNPFQWVQIQTVQFNSNLSKLCPIQKVLSRA